MDGLSKHEVEYRKNNGLANDEKIKYTANAIFKILNNVIIAARLKRTPVQF